MTFKKGHKPYFEQGFGLGAKGAKHGRSIGHAKYRPCYDCGIKKKCYPFLCATCTNKRNWIKKKYRLEEKHV
jgi:hypothetical protein